MEVKRRHQIDIELLENLTVWSYPRRRYLTTSFLFLFLFFKKECSIPQGSLVESITNLNICAPTRGVNQ